MGMVGPDTRCAGKGIEMRILSESLRGQHTAGRLAGVLVVIAIALGIAACGTASAGGHTALSCAAAPAPQGIDVLSTRLTCTVMGAPAGATSFRLHYTVVSASGSAFTPDATCGGSLQSGSGTCTETYTIPFPTASGTPSVAGELLPGHQPLGPVRPEVVRS